MSRVRIAKDNRLRSVFRMPAVQTMKTRKTSITNAFVSAIIPVIEPTDEEILDALNILGMTFDSVKCIYCGDNCNAWDHLRPIVENRRPSGFISEIANLVPACQPCNSSKGNKNWKQWMLGEARQCPKKRGVAGLESRVARLEAYEKWRTPTRVDFEKVLGSEAYAEYWRERDRIVGEMERSQDIADELREKVANVSSQWQVRPEKG